MRVALLPAALLVVAASCPPPAPRGPVDPVLYAVLEPGTPPTFARRAPIGTTYEALPARSVIFRMVNPLPEGPASVKVSLQFLDGTTGGDLELVRSDDLPRQQQLEQAGYYSVVVDGYGYSVVISPPASQRSGSGFDIVMRNSAANPPAGASALSQPLDVRIVPRAARTLPSNVFFDCGNDYDNLEGKWHHNCKLGSAVVLRNFTLQGWLTSTFSNCLSGLCWEDWHYEFVVDPDFVEAFYGPGGAFSALMGGQPLAGVMLPGNPPQAPQGQIGLVDVSPGGQARGITVNSFALPGQDPHGGTSRRAKIFGELNAWHVSNQGGTFSRHWVGRGSAPAGWVPPLIPSSDPRSAEWNNTRWPFDPANPDAGLGPLPEDEDPAAPVYVRVNGALYQDSEHGISARWEELVPGHAGWLEIHPVDWLERLPAPASRKTPALMTAIFSPGAPSTFYGTFTAEAPKQPGETLRCRELVDGRFSRMANVSRTAQINGDQLNVTVSVSGPDGRFKAIYLLWWQAGAAAGECEVR